MMNNRPNNHPNPRDRRTRPGYPGNIGFSRNKGSDLLATLANSLYSPARTGGYDYRVIIYFKSNRRRG